MQISRRQLSWSRLSRSGLVEPFETAQQAAHALSGIQAQLLPAAGLALWNRTLGFDASQLEELLYSSRSLVKLWGQRNTLHIYRTADWPTVFAAFRNRPSWFERFLEKRGRDLRGLREAERRLEARLLREGTLCRDDIREIENELDEQTHQLWSGLFMMLVRAGVACHSEPGSRNESRFSHREAWVPTLEWTPPSPAEATRTLARNYLRCYGPATLSDLAFWFGTSARNAEPWIEDLGDEVMRVTLDGDSLLALRGDALHLDGDPPPLTRWPIKLLYRFDPLLLALKDKTWLVRAEDYKRVWRPAGHVEGVVLVRDRVRGTWRYDRRSAGLCVTIRSVDRLPQSTLRVVERQARGVAAYFGLHLSDFRNEET